MKLFVIVLIVSITSPIVAQDKPQPEGPNPRNAPGFKPLIPDSLRPRHLMPFLHPERDPEYQKRHGVKLVDPYNVELNPSGIIDADPTVDLGMIYPLNTRKKLLLKKKGDSLVPRGNPYSMIPPLPERDKNDEENPKDEEKTE